MVSVFSSSVEDHEFVPRSGQTKHYKLVNAPSSFISTHSVLRIMSKIGWLRIRIMCPSRAEKLLT